tara:strand:- start:249 stop:458 length:210 start_codon:yes stop_codon:yes gene_type:complete
LAKRKVGLENRNPKFEILNKSEIQISKIHKAFSWVGTAVPAVLNKTKASQDHTSVVPYERTQINADWQD